MRFAQRVFLLSALWGFLVLPPMYFVELQSGDDYPLPLSRPEFYYGFAGLALAWQVVFLIIAYDPLRFRPLMLTGVLEKIVFGAAAIPLYFAARTPGIMALASCLDLALGVLFVAAWWQTRPRD